MTARPTLMIYGIRNCDTIKKARQWLDVAGIPYGFHDYRSQGVDADLLRGWVDALGWTVVLNRAGTTFRKLPDADKADIDATRAVALMLANPSMIKRPILQGQLASSNTPLLLAGFRPDQYRAAGLEG